jgi:hypothetical protein
MRTLGLAALCLFTAACGAYAFPGAGSSPSPNTGAVSGRVLAVPCAPVEQAGSICAGKPISGLELDYVVGETIAARAVTDDAGNYAVRLAPGGYVVKLAGFLRVVSGPTKIAVAAGSTTIADYIVDSGIRTAVPQD